MSTAPLTKSDNVAADRAASPQRQGRVTRFYSRPSSQWWPPLVVFAILVGLWYLTALYYDKTVQLPYLIPYPHLVLTEFYGDPNFTPHSTPTCSTPPRSRSPGSSSPSSSAWGGRR